MAHGQIRKCRVPKPCWGCHHVIEHGESYKEFLLIRENGPCRTIRVHSKCFEILESFDARDWETVTHGYLHYEWGDECPTCKRLEKLEEIK